LVFKGCSLRNPYWSVINLQLHQFFASYSDMNMSEATHKKVHDEDDLDASILLQSVDNIVPMDRMREKMTAMAKAHVKALAEKDRVTLSKP